MNFDDFREWLSDNLRYFMLGGGILLVVLVLFFSVRACTRLRRGNSGEETAQEETTSEETVVEETVTPAPEGDSSNTAQEPVLEENNEEIRDLLTRFYDALGSKDVTQLRTIVDNLLPEDEARITNSNDFIEKYTLGDIYTAKGLTEDSRVVFACYDFTCTGIETPAPALAELYVVKDAEGEWKVDGSAWEDSEITKFTQELANEKEVTDLLADVQTRNDEARASDADLAKFLDGLGDEVIVSFGSKGEQTTVTMVTNVQCNVRAEPSTESESLGILDEGTEVTVLGDEGEWKIVEYEGQNAYIRGDLLD